MIKILFLAFCLAIADSGYSQKGSVSIRIETEVGDIRAELDSLHAPVTVANFLRYVEGRHFDGGSFYRTVRSDNQPLSPVKIAVIQGSIHPWRENDSFAPIDLERTNQTGLRHRDGTLSMARAEPNSATFSFFICVGDQPELDYAGKRNLDGQGFAAFGSVTEGMDIVKRIHASRADGQAIMPPVRILRIVRE